MDFTDIITLIVCFGAGFYIGWIVQEKLMYITMAEMFRRAGITNAELDKFVNHWRGEFDDEDHGPARDDEGREIINIKIEKHGEVLYAFSKEDDSFLGQGDSKESLIARLGEKSTGVRLVIEEADGAAFIGGSFEVDADGKIKQTSS